MPRPATFNSDEVLERAMRTFWTYGYAGTSIADLVEVTSVQRGSMICNCIGEVVPHDSEIAKVVEKMLNEFKRILIVRLEKGVLFLQINRFMEVRLPTFTTLHNQADEAHAEAVSLLPFLRLVSFERSIHHDQYSRCHAICGHPSDLRRVGIP